jgi:hypothetical protein
MRWLVEKKPNPFEDDDLDEVVATADDTGLVSGEQEIAEEEIFEHIQREDEKS